MSLSPDQGYHGQLAVQGPDFHCSGSPFQSCHYTGPTPLLVQLNEGPPDGGRNVLIEEDWSPEAVNTVVVQEASSIYAPIRTKRTLQNSQVST